MRLLLQFAFSCLHSMFKLWSNSVDTERKVSAESVNARSVCQGSDHTYLFCFSNNSIYDWHYTQKTSAYTCRLPEEWPTRKWTLLCGLHTHALSSSSSSALARQKKRNKQHHNFIENNNSPLDLECKCWDKGDHGEVTCSQHSAVSFGTVQLHSFIVISPSHLGKGMRAPSALGSRGKLRSSLATNLVLEWQHSAKMLGDDSDIYT